MDIWVALRQGYLRHRTQYAPIYRELAERPRGLIEPTHGEAVVHFMDGKTRDLQSALLAYKAEVYHHERMAAAKDSDE